MVEDDRVFRRRFQVIGMFCLVVIVEMIAQYVLLLLVLAPLKWRLDYDYNFEHCYGFVCFYCNWSRNICKLGKLIKKKKYLLSILNRIANLVILIYQKMDVLCLSVLI